MKTWTIADLRLDRADLLQRIGANARYGRNNWQGNDERLESVEAARSLLKSGRTEFTPSEMDSIIQWGVLCPRDELVVGGAARQAPRDGARAVAGPGFHQSSPHRGRGTMAGSMEQAIQTAMEQGKFVASRVLNVGYVPALVCERTSESRLLTVVEDTDGRGVAYAHYFVDPDGNELP